MPNNFIEGASSALRAVGKGIQVASGAVVRVCKISTVYVGQLVRASYNLAGQVTFPIEQQIFGTRPPSFSDLHPAGIIILFIPISIPIILASITIVPLIGNFIQSTAKKFLSCINFFLDQTDEIPSSLTSDNNRNWLQKYFYGLPGIVVGYVLGMLAGITISIARVITNSFKTMRRAFFSAVNLSLNSKIDAEELGVNDNRGVFRQYVVGGVGFLLGGTAGLIIAMLISLGRLAVNTAMTTLGTIITVINTVLPKKIPLDEDKRTTIAKVSGVLGYPLGSIIGFIGAIFIGVGRIFTNNCKSFAWSFTQVIRLALHAQDQDQVSVPELKGRHFVWKVIGTPGYLLGGIFGFVGAIFVGVGRVFTNSCKSFARSFAQVIRLALHAKDQDEVSVPELKDRNLIGKVIGTPGYLLGGIFGFVGVVFIGIGRVFTNSCKSFAQSFTQVIRLALHEKDQDNISVPALKDRNFAGKIMGSPGYLLGGIFGFVGAVFIGVGRVFTNSCKSFARSFTQVINLALHTKDQVSVPELEGRNLAGKIKGAPGYLLGGIFGFIAMIFIVVGRVWTNSCKSFAGSFTQVINLVLHAKDQVSVPEFKHRNFVGKIMGSPGYLLGGIFGLVGAIFISVGRVLTNSCKSFARSFTQVINLALHTKDQVSVPELKDRNLIGKVIGTPGYLLGGIFGFVGTIFIGVGRVFTNSCKSFARSFTQVINLALHKNNKLPVPELKDRNLLGKIMGAPGYLLGGIAGFIGATFIGLGRVLNQSQLSFRALSGSLINGAVKRRWCADTLGNDNRTSANKDAGLLGYIAATIITAPVAGVIFFANKVLPILLAGLMGFVAFFIIAPCKFIARCCSSTKKDSDEKESKSTEKLNVSEAKVSAVIEQRFKNIHSSLDGFGSLTPNTSIVENGDGQESWGSFFRRSFTFNAKSTTERILNKLWEHYQKFKTTNNNPKEPFFDVNKGAFQNAITEVIDYYQNDVFASKEDIKESITEIEESAQFLCNYIAGSQKPEIPKNLYSKKGASWSAVFWGGPSNSPATEGETLLKRRLG